jgi:hypothetical protein
MNKKITLWIIVMILLVSTAFGLGLAPARTKLEFNQIEQSGRFRVIVDEVPSKVILSTEGDLGEYISLQNSVLVVESLETWIDFKVKLPDDLSPGEQQGGIMVFQVPKDVTKENIVVATTAIVHQIKVNVPYPGKYLTGKMFVQNSDINQPTMFTIGLANYGKEDITNVKATITIKGPTNEELAVLITEEKSIGSGNEDKLVAIWQPEHAGSYFAEAMVKYDDKITKITQQFSIGSLELEIENIKVNNFKLGQIAKFDIYLLNKWNKPFTVNGNVKVIKDGQLVSSFNTIPIDIDEQSSAVMEGYWSTEGLEVGEYDVTIKASYEGKTSEKTVTSIISLNDVVFKGFDVTSRVVKGNESKRTTFIIIFVFILILMNIALFVYINKRINNNNNNCNNVGNKNNKNNKNNNNNNNNNKY